MASETGRMDIEEMQARAFGGSLDRGFHKGVVAGQIDPLYVLSLLALVHTEVSEAVECVRAGETYDYELNGKPRGLAIELADIVLRVGDLAGLLGIDLTEAIERKLDYNATRPHKHGGKLL